MAPISPPLLPTTAIYTKQYCEENIYLLAQTFSQDPSVSELWDIFVAFISNETRSVALKNQKAAREPNSLVIWDYHVVLLIRGKGTNLRQPEPQTFFTDTDEACEKDAIPRAWVYDFDTTIKQVPCPLRDNEAEESTDYLHETFFPFDCAPYTSMFRVIKADEFLMNFASDRSHMAVLDISDDLPSEDALPPEYAAPPPLYPAICGAAAVQKGIKTNLMSSFVSMTDGNEAFGEVLDLQTLYSWR